MFNKWLFKVTTLPIATIIIYRHSDIDQKDTDILFCDLQRREGFKDCKVFMKAPEDADAEKSSPTVAEQNITSGRLFSSARFCGN